MHKLCWGILTCFSLQNVMANTEFDSLLAMNFDQLASIEVTTAARSPQALKDVQGSLWVVTDTDIRLRGYRHLADLLRDLPSIDIQGPYSTSSRISVRGVTGNTKLLILQDGVRIGAPAGELVPVSINYPLYMAKQVEVLLTPGAALYGADAVSGVINIITRSAEQDTQSLSYEGSESRYQHGHLLVNGKVGQRALSVGAHQEQFNNQALAAQYPEVFTFNDLKDNNGQVVIPVAQRQAFQSRAASESVWAKVAVLPEVELGLSYRVLRYPTDFTTLPDFTNYGGFWEDRFITLYGRYQSSEAERLSTNTLVSWSHYRLDKDSYFNNVFSGYQAGYKYAESKKMTIDSQWRYWLDDNHTLIAGLVFDHLRAIPRTTDLSQPYNPNLSADVQNLYYLGSTLPVKVFKVAQDNIGLFVQSQSRWSPQLSSQLGIRFDDNSDYQASTSPSLGFKYVSSNQSRWSMTYSQAYLAPSPSYSYEHFGSFNGQQDAQGRYLADTFRIPNPDLQPETAQALEAIFSQDLTKQWQWSMTAYRSRLKNLILFATETPSPVHDFIEGGWISKTDHNVNLGESVAYGVELSSRYRYSALRADIWANYSFTEGYLETPKGEEELPYNAKHKLKLGATWRSMSGWFVSPTGYWIGQSRVPSSASDGVRSITVPSYQLLNVYLGREQIIEGVNVFARVENLTSKKYYHAGGSSKKSLVQLPQLNRTITLGVSLDF